MLIKHNQKVLRVAVIGADTCRWCA